MGVVKKMCGTTRALHHPRWICRPAEPVNFTSSKRQRVGRWALAAHSLALRACMRTLFNIKTLQTPYSGCPCG